MTIFSLCLGAVTAITAPAKAEGLGDCYNSIISWCNDEDGGVSGMDQCIGDGLDMCDETDWGDAASAGPLTIFNPPREHRDLIKRLVAAHLVLARQGDPADDDTGRDEDRDDRTADSGDTGKGDARRPDPAAK